MDVTLPAADVKKPLLLFCNYIYMSILNKLYKVINYHIGSHITQMC